MSTLQILINLKAHQPLVILNQKDIFAVNLDEFSIPYIVIGGGYPLKNFASSNLYLKLRAIVEILLYNLRIWRALWETNTAALQCEETGALLVCFGTKLAGKKLVIYVRNSFRGDSLRGVYKLPMWFADSVVGISAEVSRFLLEKGGLNIRRKVTQIYNGLDLSEAAHFKRQFTKQECRAHLEIPAECTAVGIVAFIDERKQQREFLRYVANGFKKNAKMRFYFIGGIKNEMYMTECMEIVLELYLENVFFVGVRSNMSEWYRSLDIVCLPSEREGVPRALIEASAFELPTVAFDIPGCREAVVDHETGFVVQSFDEFSARLEELANNPSLCREMGQKGCAYVSEHFDAVRNTTAIERIYETIQK